MSESKREQIAKALFRRFGSHMRFYMNEDFWLGAADAVLAELREPTEDMVLAGAKAAAEQLHYKADAWGRCIDDEFKPDYLNAAKYSWQAAIKVAAG